MISNYLNYLKLHTSLFGLSSKTKSQKGFLFPLAFTKLRQSYYSSLHVPIKNGSHNGGYISKEQKMLCLFKKCCSMKEIELVHGNVIKTGLTQNLYVIGKIIVFCAVSQRGSMDYAVSIFEKIEIPDGFLWNTMIRGFVRTKQVEKAFEYYKKMQENGEIVDNFTMSFLVKLCGRLGSVMLGKQLHCSVIKYELESHVFVRNTMIHMYGMLKDVGTAYRLFEEIPKPKLVDWNTIIDCHVHCGKYQEALDLFLKMQRCAAGFDDATLVVILSACSALGALDFGKWLHYLVDHTGFIGHVSICNALVDMYAKCGAVEEAYKIFCKMYDRNLVTWNTMISGLAAHGYAYEALKLFSRMLEEKIELPDDVTFLGVLSACNHGGKVEEGRRYFQCMIDKYRIQPTIKHYGCVVDILGRAGFVEEAYELIRSMPMNCNAIVYRTLLAACRLHGKMELGEQVRRHLLELEPDHSSDYVLLANMYASAQEWNEMARVRKSMSNRGVQKPMPGNSVIGVSTKK